ncbi:hypothetical protein IGI04_041063 [Brassica rapa subsp. trilocularis]|uniref:FAD/NAD(P)-binding domain-containing protein n=1 Tax=Brassica rapa subsp. trilocularis TaxID=1813537 RepID=A0ABQ7KR79_BRACM|nr:hypothetical protein IGI04_041063 [Brassica rapa subsp. trilocularis]
MAEIESESKQGRRVVVIGGRVAGSLAAKLLQFHADVILIDPKEYFEITWASLRSMVEPSFAERTVINHKNYFKKGRVVTSPAVNITETDVMTADGDVIGYDYTILADCHFLCVGKPMSSQWLNGNSLKDSLDGKGRVMVDENLRIKDRKNVFAIGDITNIPVRYIGEMHANMAVNNIKVMMSGGEKKKKMSTYKPGSEMAIVSLGRKYSVAQDSHWLPPWFDQVQGSIRGEDKRVNPKCVHDLPQISKLSVEEHKRRGRGTFTYKKDVMYSDRDFCKSRFDDVGDDDVCRGSEKTDGSLKYGGFLIRWVNDTTALAVLPLLLRLAIVFNVRSFTIRVPDDHDSLLSSISEKDLKPPTQRPKTSARTAQRLIAHSMGLKLPASGFGSKELRDQEAARKNRIVSRQKQRDDAWGAD